MKKGQQLSEWYGRFAPILILIAFCIIFTAFNPRFLSLRNMRILAQQSAILWVIAMGGTFVILAGSIDLSVEGIMAMSSVTLSLLVLNLRNNNNFGLLGVLIAALIGAGFGCLNGLIHAKVKIPSLLVTLGTSFIGTGLAVVIYKGHPIRIKDATFRSLSIGNILGIPTIFIIASIIFIFAIFLERYTRFGRYVYAIGGGERQARLVGIPVDFYKILMFTMSGLFFGLGGILNAGRIGVGTAMVGTGAFQAIAAVVIGGTALSGGVGGMFRTLIGVWILTVMNNGMILMRINPYIQDAVVGAFMIIAVIVTIDRSKILIMK